MHTIQHAYKNMTMHTTYIQYSITTNTTYIQYNTIKRSKNDIWRPYKTLRMTLFA